MAEASAPPIEDLSSQMAGVNIQGSSSAADGSAGTSPIVSTFTQGCLMVLQSVNSGSVLGIYDGQASGKGIRDSYSQFVVHVRRFGVIALQNVAHPDCWLSIFEGRTLGSGNGGPYSEFTLHEIEDKYIALESAFYPGQYVGIQEDGTLLPPGETPFRDRASLFVSFPHSPITDGYPGSTYTNPSVAVTHEEPPPYPGPPTSQGYGYQAPLSVGSAAPVPPQSSPSLPHYRPPTHVPPPTHVLPPTHTPPQTRVPYPPQQCLSQAAGSSPLGYQISDVFSRFNVLIFLSSIDPRPLKVARGITHNTLRIGGTFCGADSQFVVEATQFGGTLIKNAAHGTIMVNYLKKIYVTKAPRAESDIGYEFHIHSIAGPVVAFESIKFPGHFMSVGRDGVVRLDGRDMETNHVRFTVRVNKFNGHYSNVITSPFSSGRPSIVNQLKDRTVVQLYYKPTMQFVCLMESGKVLPSKDDQPGSFLLLQDRGMGSVSFQGYQRPMLKLRMKPLILRSTGTEDSNTDFYIRESPDGTLMFESVVFPEKYIHLKIGRDSVVKNFSVFLVDMNRRIQERGGWTAPKYALN